MKFWFTFGCGQPHENCYHVIVAENSEEARKNMFQQFGTRWAMQYDSAEDAGVDRFGLHEIK